MCDPTCLDGQGRLVRKNALELHDGKVVGQFYKRGWGLGWVLHALLNKLNQFYEVPFIGFFHRGDVLITNFVPLSHELNLRPLRYGEFTGVQENIGDQSCMASVSIGEGVYGGQAMLDSCCNLYHRHGGLCVIPRQKISR